MSYLITTLGPKSKAELGIILAHEHVFVDLRTWDKPGYAQAEIADVIKVIGPEVVNAQAAGITALVECSTVGVGRRVDILRAVSEATSFPMVAPTGIYREPWVPDWAHAASEDELYEWMKGELEDEIQPGGIQAGFIKLSAGDDGLTPVEEKILRAAGRAGRDCNAAIGSHTIRGRVVRNQLAVLGEVGYPIERFIWIHANVEPEVEINLELARRGVWIEYDGIGGDQSDIDFVSRILRLLESGLGGRILLSQDRGWYDPARPHGGKPRPFTYITAEFLPRLRAAGVDEDTICLLTCDNPFRAFAR